ncbi:hypothetical protein [uncultured Kingella sp.]|uniref:hypothetical protein n=1 Tax=uncultured Kingella sp. TaxID=159270 RepID=UPI00259464B9|nr:hypothetical protein [uncultured Kingella sp.]
MGAITHPRQPEKPNLCFQAATVKPHSRTGAAMQPVALNDIPDEVFLEDIFELTAALAEELPALFNIMCASLSIAPEDLLITDFVEDQNDEEIYEGFAYDRRRKKMYAYLFDHDRVQVHEVATDSLTMRDTFSVRVLHLL